MNRKTKDSTPETPISGGTAAAPLWHVAQGEEPLVATAIHDGHEVRDELRDLFSLSEAERLREEDPHTGVLAAAIATTHVIPKRSRYEVDLNRPREKAVYLTPEDAWGSHVWKTRLSDESVERSLAIYDAFYAELARTYSRMQEQFGAFVVFDLHSYNHRRDGPRKSAADPDGNPDVNVGTGTMNRARWARVVDRFISDLRAFDFGGRHLDVRENIKFQGGNHPRWTHQQFPDSGCVLAIEFKKFFMDEWTGNVYPEQLELVEEALRFTVTGVLEEIQAM